MTPLGKGLLIAYGVVLALWILLRIWPVRRPARLWCGCLHAMPHAEWSAKHDEQMVTLEEGVLVRRSICREYGRFRDVPVQWEAERT